MQNADLILTLTVGLTVALVFGYLAFRLGLSPIVGYLLAGVIIGPTTPGFVADKHIAEQFAEIGVILLMFGVGLHFHVEELMAVKKIAVPGAVAHSLAAAGAGAVAAYGLGWGWAAGAVFGLALSVASTVVLTRVLTDSNEMHTQTGHVAIGWLIVEDIFAVLVLVLLPPIFGGGEGMALTLGIALLKLGGLMALALPVGGRVIPLLLNRVADTGSRELFTLTILAVALGIAVGSAMLFGVSMALGAFLAGMVVGRSEFSLRAASDALPMRDAFAVLFFVSVGMLFDPKQFLADPLPALATMLVVLVAKPVLAVVAVLVLRYPVKLAISIGIAMGQIGEFTFILADLGTKLEVLPPAATNALVAAAIVSISLNPLWYRLVGPTEAWLSRRPGLWGMLTARLPAVAGADAAPAAEPRYRAVVIGYGPVGRTLARILKENGIEPTAVEMNLETVRRLRAEGMRAVYGDAARRETLEQAGVATADTLVLSASSLHGSEEVVRLARQLNPHVRVLARSAYLKERADLKKAGADEVFAGEGEVALAMAESVLRELGAGPEQIDRERERVRTDLFGEPTAANGAGDGEKSV